MSTVEGLPAQREFSSRVHTIPQLIDALGEAFRVHNRDGPLFDILTNRDLGKAEAYREVRETLLRLLREHEATPDPIS